MFAKLFALAFVAISLNANYDMGNCHSFQPVCGANNVTYQNACQCRKAKIVIEKPGYCNRQFQIKWVKPKPCESPYCAITTHNSHEMTGDHHHGHHHGKHHGNHHGYNNLMNQYSWQNASNYGGHYNNQWWQNQAFMGQNNLMNMDHSGNYEAMAPVANLGLSYQTWQAPVAQTQYMASSVHPQVLAYAAPSVQVASAVQNTYAAPVVQTQVSAPAMNVQVNANHDFVGSSLGEVSDVMGASLSHDWNVQPEGAWTNVDLNDGQWNQVQLDGFNMSYSAGDQQVANDYGVWQGDQWVVSNAANANVMGQADYVNDAQYWMSQDAMNMASQNMMNLDYTSSDLNALDMDAQMLLDLNASQMTGLPSYPAVQQLPSETKMLGPDLSGINFNQLDSKKFNLYNNEWIKTHGSDAWWATAPSDESKITLVGDAL